MIVLAYLAGMWVDVMEIDATQYATMGRDMMRSGDFFHLFDRGRDYLDKPPLTFWMTALSFKLLGVSTIAYKLPSVLFSFMAIYGTQRLGSLLYNHRTGILAGVILGSTQAFFLMNNDVKTDMYMIGPMVMGLWQLVRWTRGERAWHLVWGAMFLGIGLLAKGPVALIAPGLAIGADMLLRRDWVPLLRWQWLLVIPIALLVTTPFLIGQYQQYGMKGVNFFLWTQSFGRVTGQSEWANDATAFFFVHSFAWSFLPWTALFLCALSQELIRIVRKGFFLPKSTEGVSVAGFLLVFTALCFSRFKLPHYIFVTYPFAAILTAAFWMDANENPLLRRWKKSLLGIHVVSGLLAALVVGVLVFWAFPAPPLWPKVLLCVFMLAIFVDYLLTKQDWVRFLWPTALCFATCNLALNIWVYPAIVSYQSTAQAGKYIRGLDEQPQIHAFLVSGRALDFYAPAVTQPIYNLADFQALLERQSVYVYTHKEGLAMVSERGMRFEMVQAYPHFPPNKLTLRFLNPETRPDVVKERYLLRLPQQTLEP